MLPYIDNRRFPSVPFIPYVEFTPFTDKTIQKKNPYTIKMPLICQGGGDECGIGGRAPSSAQPHHHPFGNSPKVQWQPHQCTLNQPGRTRVAIFPIFPLVNPKFSLTRVNALNRCPCGRLDCEVNATKCAGHE